MSDWTWKPCRPGDKYCITPSTPVGESLPYTVAKIIIKDRVCYEAWHGKDWLSGHGTAAAARQACADHWAAHQ